jgi:hypothetical protein
MRNFWILGILVLGFSGMIFGGETSADGHASQQAEATSAWNGILHPGAARAHPGAREIGTRSAARFATRFAAT